MLTPPNLSDDRISECLRDAYGLHIVQSSFLPLGADLNSASYRVDTRDGTPYFLKLRRSSFNEVAVTVPAYLHHVRGIPSVVAPLPTLTRRLHMRAHGFHWILYPFINGRTGFECAPTDAQWEALGAALKRVHSSTPPPELLRQMPRDSCSPCSRNVVRHLSGHLDRHAGDDSIIRRLSLFWREKHGEIDMIAARADRLCHVLAGMRSTPVVCHADIHAGNILLSGDGSLHIVDWDTVVLAPKERDLMFLGSGVGGIWNTPREVARFYKGYGDTCIDRFALCYYRYERIVTDIAEICELVLDVRNCAKDRMEGLRQMVSQFLPNNMVDMAHRTYQRIS